MIYAIKCTEPCVLFSPYAADIHRQTTFGLKPYTVPRSQYSQYFSQVVLFLSLFFPTANHADAQRRSVQLSGCSLLIYSFNLSISIVQIY